jgi:hypothetical protein
VKLNRTSSQNKDIQKVNSSNRCHGMTRHEIAYAMVLASALMGGISPLDVRHFEYYQRGGGGGGGECLSNAHWLGQWRQHFDDELRLRQNHWKIIGKTKQLGFCVA